MFVSFGLYVIIDLESGLCVANMYTHSLTPFILQQVASMDPLIVFYIDGYARIGNADYDESDFSNTRNHLTTHTFLGEEGKASQTQLNQRILDHVAENPHLQQTIPDPVGHVRNQFKESIGMLVDAFKDRTFKTGPPLDRAEDSFEFYGADCVIDNDLDIWMIEAQDDTGIDGEYFAL